MAYIIHYSLRYQELRVSGGLEQRIPFSFSVVILCSCRLAGLPFFSAFFSKEVIIEVLGVAQQRLVRFWILLAGIALTLFYRARLLLLASSCSSKQFPLALKADLDFTSNTAIKLLIFPALLGGKALGVMFADYFYVALFPPRFKYAVYFLLLMGGFLGILLSFYPSFLFQTKWTWLFNLWILDKISRKIPGKLALNSGDHAHKILFFSWLWFFSSTRIYQWSLSGMLKNSKTSSLFLDCFLTLRLGFVLLAIYLCILTILKTQNFIWLHPYI